MVAGREIRLPLRTFKYKIMKKLILFLAIAAVLASCKTDEPKVFQIDPSVTVNIKGLSSPQKVIGISKVGAVHLSNLEIVKQTYVMNFTMPNGGAAGRGFDPMQRDTVSTVPMLKMWGTDILYYECLIDGTQTGDVLLALDFLEATNCVFLNIKGDTLAYIPNAVLRSAETQIKALFADKNYELIYTIFNNAYTFTPITGAEWRALQN